MNNFETQGIPEFHETDEQLAKASLHAAMGEFSSDATPDVSDLVKECNEKLSESHESIGDIFSDIVEGIKDFSEGVYEGIKDFFTGTHEAAEKDYENLGQEFTEARDFGLEKCSDAAAEIFTAAVISEWPHMTYEERRDLALAYAKEVAAAFELQEYYGTIIESMDPNMLGFNCGDGYIHLSDVLLNPTLSPFEIINTITHELRHQYQNECVRGYHDISEEVRQEWATASEIYTTNDPYCYDPWGYRYNPLEIDSNYAGNTVIDNISTRIFNDNYA